MQEKTINNALIALRKQGGSQGMLAEVLLDMRGVDMPSVKQFMPYKRGGVKRLILQLLNDKPRTTSEIAVYVRKDVPEICERMAYNRAYQALLRMRDSGVVKREGRVWMLAP